MVRRSEPLLLTFGIRANYEIKLSLTIFQIFHKDHCNLKVRLFIFGKRSNQFRKYLLQTFGQNNLGIRVMSCFEISKPQHY